MGSIFCELKKSYYIKENIPEYDYAEPKLTGLIKEKSVNFGSAYLNK